MDHSIPLTRPFVLQLEEQLLAAMKASDVQALDQLLHDDLLFIIPNGQTITKRMDLDSHRAKQMVVEQLTAHYEQISLINDCAVVTLTLDTKGVMMNERIEGSYRYIRVWKMTGDLCRVIAGSCTAI